MTSLITLRAATPADIPLLRHWDEQPHVISANPNDPWNWEADLATSADWQEHWIAELDGRPIGFIEIIDPAREESHYWGDVPTHLRALDIWIGEASDLGRGYGTAMMQLALTHCFADPAVTAVLVDPLANNTRAHRFYERQGFKFLQHQRFGEDNCSVFRLSRAEWQQAMPGQIPTPSASQSPTPPG
ncbi:GNAT family N-acetyltransferase [Synechococcales cyanobacterium C]|uniref:GNAT family N-acetyltransferase n=1 Tax=Petrachloros mirabilis ULC683 TaxID=2781853 RepID=A0A8K2A175_9CYAN|nr:GNAT family N-acetyltransferase [Petrachloros mirabilis]NCJ07891.1 GNAT family N-acetyltransferase [Petrachloros mirabilis ULC683]